MLKIRLYDPAQRQQEKERQRALDAAALQSGQVSPDQLRVSNGFLSSLEVIDSSIACKEVFS
ncbi:hypothetical protein [Novosphingobium sp. KACC 22771]|uniref:hypothetical protein n=1 Tax=Novosphingobium sp. KACC 22771 TaxID=3025670 RepID=UPI002366CF15|nr:hypothetical protein [Novosphingobium sp. KACC 22771]WDF73616.1 hypothetical protein PQ467_06140 [Novosphingobium sp. KACC 22771]